ncbi:MAG: hypothetical protein IT462_01375 [Planctomycetes bacterium]|nr:hypothetical protein [Planctomycetota bacterium]
MAEQARIKEKPIGFALLLGWLLPGLGHIYMGRRAHGALYGVVILGLYAAGVALSNGTAVSIKIHDVYFYCQILAGPLTIGMNFLGARGDWSLGNDLAILDHQTGVVYAALAGVLNLIVLCELHRRWEIPDAPGPGDTIRATAAEEKKA